MCIVSSKMGKFCDLTLTACSVPHSNKDNFVQHDTQEMACVGDEFWLFLK